MVNQKKKIEKILESFDFRKTKDAMVNCGITWQNEKGEEYVPSQEEIKERARFMLNNAVNTKMAYCKISSDGLIVRKTATTLELSFTIEFASA